MTKAVIFDMDGVLVDNRDIHIEAFMQWCDIHGLKMERDVLTSYFGMGNNEIFPLVLKREDMTAEQIQQYSDEKEAIYRRIIADSIEPVRGLIDVLEGLKALGVKIAVGSSGMRKNVDFVLEKCGIAKYFEVIIDGDQLHRAKPDPEVFLLAAKELGVEPSECLVCEDSFAGIEAARAAGMKVVALSTTFPAEQHKDHELLINDFSETSAQQMLAL